MFTKVDVAKAVKNYFEERAIQDLMCYGASRDEGLNDISEPYAEILENLGFEVQGHFAEDGFGDGKYVVYLDVPAITKDRIEIPVKAWDGIEEVTDDIFEILKDYNTSIEDEKLHYSLEMSFILNDEYYPDSDIQLGTFNNFNDAYKVACNIAVQDASLYECYIYALNEQSEIVNTYRVF
ncbi:MAG: hypothetical protein J6T10_30725 [Methanobrevibacter sp.]|nr:hypothetical protein [Methanobrevibacter sp.]